MILGGSLLMAAIAVTVIVPMLIDDQKIRSLIEAKLSETAGRPFKLEGDLRLSLFPWASIEVSDVRLENPPGFEEKDAINAESFSVHMRLIPLISSLFKDIQVKRFALEGVRIVLEIQDDGKTNWDGIGKKTTMASTGAEEEYKESPVRGPEGEFPIKAIEVAEFAITRSSFLRIDHTKGARLELSDLNLRLVDFSLDRPIRIAFSGRIDGRPIALEGSMGPLGTDFTKGVIPVDLKVNALEQMEVRLKGSVAETTSNPRFDMSFEVLPFSPRKLAAEMRWELPVATADSKAFSNMAFAADLGGDRGKILISDGVIKLDQSTLHFSGSARDFSRPDVRFDLKVDEIDLDRYLSGKTDEKSDPDISRADSDGGKSGQAQAKQKKADYESLRRILIEGAIEIKRLKAANVRIQDLKVKIAGKKGVFNLDPLALRMYQGDLSVGGVLNLTEDTPETSLRIQAKDIQIGPLITDITQKDIFEGRVRADVALRMKGSDADGIKRSLNGKGDFSIEDGAVEGIDLVAMVRNTDSAYGFSKKTAEKPKTEFSEFNIPFNLKNGVFYSDGIRMVSTLVRVKSKGEVDLVGETLAFRIEPTFVTTRKKDKRKMKRSEVMVPVLVSGTISEPKFRPDLKGIAKQELEEEIFESSKFKELFEKEELKPLEQGAKGLLKGILDGFSGPGKE